MNKNLLIVGAGIYGDAASEISKDMGCFKKIDFVDTRRKMTQNGTKGIRATQDHGKLAAVYHNIMIAIESLEVRVMNLKMIQEKTTCRIVPLISPLVYISPSAQIMGGYIIEPMAAVHANCILGPDGCKPCFGMQRCCS